MSILTGRSLGLGRNVDFSESVLVFVASLSKVSSRLISSSLFHRSERTLIRRSPRPRFSKLPKIFLGSS